MNNWTGIGRLTKDPEVRYTTDQMAIARFSVAIDDGYGEKKKTNFIPIVVFGKQAENCERFLAKGKLVGIEGKIQTGSYTKQDGSKAYTTDIIANRVEFISGANKTQENANQSGSDGNDMGIPEGFSAITDEDIPF